MKRFHLGWFTPFGTTAWDDPLSASEEPWDGQFYVEMAKSLERACFDLIMLEDSLSICMAAAWTRICGMV
jgi:hypothetical protein